MDFKSTSTDVAFSFYGDVQLSDCESDFALDDATFTFYAFACRVCLLMGRGGV